jgi:hypothetical protein
MTPSRPTSQLDSASIFRQAWRSAPTFHLSKSPTRALLAKYNLDISSDNTASFDIPIDDVSQNQFYNQFPVLGTAPRPTSCDNNNTGFTTIHQDWV